MEITKKQFMLRAQVYDAWETDHELGAIIIFDGEGINLSVKRQKCPVCNLNASVFSMYRTSTKVMEVIASDSQGCRCNPDKRFTASVNWIIQQVYSVIGKKHTMIHYSDTYAKFRK